jgi:methylated-DNA-protein-cysteine methyltransferase related protein
MAACTARLGMDVSPGLYRMHYRSILLHIALRRAESWSMKKPCNLFFMRNKSITFKASNKKPVVKETPKSTTGTYSFFTDVFEVVRQVPKGRVTTYGAIAAYLGSRLSARMVGWAMNASHGAIPKVPAQRVVNRNGMLSGKHHFATPHLMEELLKKDGVQVKKDTVTDFSKRFWDPATELAL